jgi:Spy/CpxP family protein refolding chaperone
LVTASGGRTMSDPAGMTGSAGRPLVAALVLAVVLLAGLMIGVMIDRTFLLPRMHGRFGFDWHGPHGPPRDREFRERFARELGLTPEQKIRIDSIMDRQGLELRAVRGQVQPQLDSIITRTRRSLDSVLTPEQQKKAEAIRKRHPPPPGPPRGNFPGGPGEQDQPPPPRR